MSFILLLPPLTLNEGQPAVKSMLLRNCKMGLQDTPASLPEMANVRSLPTHSLSHIPLVSLMILYSVLWVMFLLRWVLEHLLREWKCYITLGLQELYP